MNNGWIDGWVFIEWKIIQYARMYTCTYYTEDGKLVFWDSSMSFTVLAAYHLVFYFFFFKGFYKV